MSCEIFSLCEAQAPILTVNQRLATYLESEFAAFQLSQQPLAGEKPLFISFEEWLSQQYTTVTGSLLLTAFEEHTLWHSVVMEQKESYLVNTLHLAKLAQEAWKYCQQWGIPLQKIDIQHKIEASTFVQWASAFKEQLRKLQRITTSQLASDCMKPHIFNAISWPKKIILAGFDEFTPSEEHLLELLKTQCEIVRYHSPSLPAEIHQVILKDTRDEIQSMAQWARYHFERNPQIKIGCIIPRLTQLREKVETIFTEVFSIAHFLSDQPDTVLPFNLSVSKSFNQYALIQFALHCLNFCYQSYSVDQVRNLLHSPYLNFHQADQLCALEVEKIIHRQKWLTLSSLQLGSLIQQATASHPDSTLANRWEYFLFQLKQAPSVQYPSQWANYFTQLLQALHWPFQKPLSLLEGLVIHRWKKLLVEFSQLDTISKRITLAEALAYFHQLVSATLFQPSNENASIQILGTLESTGILFDKLWVMRLSHDQWPQASSPSPLLPVYQQRQWNFPHSSAQRELDYAQKTLSRLAHSAHEVIFSSPTQEKDQQLIPSSLIQLYPLLQQEALKGQDYSSYEHQLLSTAELEYILDEQAPVLQPAETPKGGSYILKEQALCPFRSFVHTRLKARLPDELSPGPTSLEQGSLIHLMLEYIWSRIRTHGQLLALSDEQLNKIIEESLSVAFSRLQFNEQINVFLINTEKKRLQKLIYQWLLFEKEREPFTVVECEIEKIISLNALTLYLKIDRIDQLSDGSTLIIDYKSGISRVNDWFGSPIIEPQLPLYCLSEENVEAIAFAQIREDNMKFKGVGKHADRLAGLIPLKKIPYEPQPQNWEQLLVHWKEVLHQLADSFCQGEAAVQPLNPSVCEYCDLQAACRIHEKITTS